jgi:CheY-like chemotaxis protein
MGNKVVLVLEDDHNLQESVRRLVETSGYKVVTARSLAEATSLLERVARPCLILLDALMHVGREAMAELGTRYPLATIPVRVSASNGRRITKRSVHLELLREMLRLHCGHPGSDTPVPSTST